MTGSKTVRGHGPPERKRAAWLGRPPYIFPASLCGALQALTAQPHGRPPQPRQR
jgi:hypothetical protein